MTGARKTALRVLSGLLYGMALVCVFIAMVPFIWGAPHRFILWSATGTVAVLCVFFAAVALMATLSREKAERLARATVWALFLAYVLVVVYLLFIMRRGDPFTLEELKQLDLKAYAASDNMNLVPFATLRRYLGVARRGVIVRIALGNIMGNVVLFMPLGILLPLLGRVTGKPYVALPLLLLLPLLCEALQLVLRCGVADIDDFLFNAVGGILAYAIMWLPFLRKPLQKGLWWPCRK